MQCNRSDPSIVPGDPKLSEQALLKETDLQRCIESLQCAICDLLIENEKLRQCLMRTEVSKWLGTGEEGNFSPRKRKRGKSENFLGGL